MRDEREDGMTRRFSGLALAVSALLGLAGAAEMDAQAPADKPPTVEEAKKFADDAEAALLKLWVDQSRIDWVKSTYITDDTLKLAAQAADKSIAAGVKYAKQATRYDKLTLPPETARKLKLLKLSLTLAAPVGPVRVGGADADRARRWKAPTARASTARPRTSASTSRTSRRSWRPRATRRSSLDVWAGWHAVGGPDEEGLRALRGARATRAPGSSASRTRARCGAPSTT